MNDFHPEYRLVKVQGIWEAQMRLVDDTLSQHGRQWDLTTLWRTFKRSADKEICELAIQGSMDMDKRYEGKQQ